MITLTIDVSQSLCLDRQSMTDCDRVVSMSNLGRLSGIAAGQTGSQQLEKSATLA